jgi:hypothetical protein
VTVLRLEQAPTAGAIAGDAFEAGYLTGAGLEQRVPPPEAWATTPFEDGVPVRRFTARKARGT